MQLRRQPPRRAIISFDYRPRPGARKRARADAAFLDGSRSRLRVERSPTGGTRNEFKRAAKLIFPVMYPDGLTEED